MRRLPALYRLVSARVVPARVVPARLGLLCLALVFAGIGCAPGNQEACLRYVEAQNEAYRECGMDERVIDEQELELTCPATLNEGLNCVDYYDRLASSFACENGEVVWDSSGSCS